jgi:spermidine synthase/MFS family permease
MSVRSKLPTAPVTSPRERWIYLAFFVSGFCSLVYQVIWTRLAFASFGITTPVLSVVISVFMLGLSIGSWAGGRYIAWLRQRTGQSAAIFYALSEFIIGLGSFAVPRCFAFGERLLLHSHGSDSLQYLFSSAVVLAICILPWCIFMGATFPLMMAYIRETNPSETGSFSYLYVANVLGAMCGTFLSAMVFVECLGFHHTLQLTAAGNFAVAFCALLLGAQRRRKLNVMNAVPPDETRPPAAAPVESNSAIIKWILFSTGFSAMGMEVVWTRLFTPVLKTEVYSFALIVFVYLGATLVGSLWYRRHLSLGRALEIPLLMALLAVLVFLPIPASDPRLVTMDLLFTIHPVSACVVLASIFPICAVLGYLTPGLIDRFSQGNPATAGRAYAINVVGCILGPLVASYLLLPFVSERAALLILSLPLLAFYVFFLKTMPIARRTVSFVTCGALAIFSLGFAHDFSDSLTASSSRVEVRRDYAASVISADPGGQKKLLVNGIGMTTLTPITKFMIHLPMTFHKDPPRSALVICFGMGTSYRSALSWDVDTTAVELIPSVPRALAYYQPDAAAVLKNPHGRIVIDDGRRFLRRTPKRYDVIAIDPPPPLEAAGSSLLYSTQFYDLLKEHLNENGIVQIWLPGGNRLTDLAAMRSVYSSFPHVRCFPSVEPGGVHILASMQPMEPRSPEELAARMPESARRDLLEWAGPTDAAAYLAKVVTREVPVEKLLNPDLTLRITDDNPFNEYFLLRRQGILHPGKAN